MEDISLLSWKISNVEYMISRMNSGTDNLSVGITTKPSGNLERHEERHYVDIDNHLSTQTVDLIRKEVLKSLYGKKEELFQGMKEAVE